ncbi:hypothetical protein BDD12DRAFT_368970 [Trichophaea hybrida]|nr:hypothetical protein BDD12DRAFT_368970 [Trichophaea hybrida]
MVLTLALLVCLFVIILYSAACGHDIFLNPQHFSGVSPLCPRGPPCVQVVLPNLLPPILALLVWCNKQLGVTPLPKYSLDNAQTLFEILSVPECGRHYVSARHILKRLEMIWSCVDSHQTVFLARHVFCVPRSSASGCETKLSYRIIARRLHRPQVAVAAVCCILR